MEKKIEKELSLQKISIISFLSLNEMSECIETRFNIINYRDLTCIIRDIRVYLYIAFAAIFYLKKGALFGEFEFQSPSKILQIPAGSPYGKD